MKLANLILALAFIAAGGVAHAEKHKSLHDQFTGQGYGVAGCGLGSIVFGDKPGMIQVIAVTLNQYSFQTFAISSGTSNCGESGKTARATQFIEVNKVALENDLARGTGESVVALGEVMGCQNTDFSTQLRRQYTTGTSTEQFAQIASKNCTL